MIESIQEDMCRLNVNILPFHFRNWNILDFGICKGAGASLWQTLRKDPTFFYLLINPPAPHLPTYVPILPFPSPHLTKTFNIKLGLKIP
jgi:hypothetical protein